jgi:hypothetical protein
MNSKRNDAWLNSQYHSVIGCWLANVNFRLTLDLGTHANGFLLKYVCTHQRHESHDLSDEALHAGAGTASSPTTITSVDAYEKLETDG